MLRFSAIMEQVLAKIEPLRVQSEQAIQAGLVGTEDLQVYIFLTDFFGSVHVLIIILGHVEEAEIQRCGS